MESPVASGLFYQGYFIGLHEPPWAVCRVWATQNLGNPGHCPLRLRIKWRFLVMDYEDTSRAKVGSLSYLGVAKEHETRGFLDFRAFLFLPG